MSQAILALSYVAGNVAIYSWPIVDARYSEDDFRDAEMPGGWFVVEPLNYGDPFVVRHAAFPLLVFGVIAEFQVVPDVPVQTALSDRVIRIGGCVLADPLEHSAVPRTGDRFESAGFWFA